MQGTGRKGAGCRVQGPGCRDQCEGARVHLCGGLGEGRHDEAVGSLQGGGVLVHRLEGEVGRCGGVEGS